MEQAINHAARTTDDMQKKANVLFEAVYDQEGYLVVANNRAERRLLEKQRRKQRR